MLVVIVSYMLEQLTEADKLGPIDMEWLATRQGKGGIVGIAFGLLLLGFVFVLPGGVIDGLRRLRAKFVTVVPRPAWLSEVERSRAAVTHSSRPSSEAPDVAASH